MWSDKARRRTNIPFEFWAVKCGDREPLLDGVDNRTMLDASIITICHNLSNHGGKQIRDFLEKYDLFGNVFENKMKLCLVLVYEKQFS